MELIVFPDAVLTTITAINARLAEVGYPTVAAVGWIPDPRPAQFVRVLRVGGARSGLVIDEALLVVEGWARSPDESLDLTQAARAIVNAMEGTVIAGVTVYSVVESSGPANLPDLDSTQQRHTFTTQVACRGRVPDVVTSN